MANGECLFRLVQIGIAYQDAVALRRIAMTLHRWHELECGDGNSYGSWAIEREGPWAIMHINNRPCWWDGEMWAERSGRRTYDEGEKAALTVPGPVDSLLEFGRWVETDERPLLVHHHYQHGRGKDYTTRTAIPDRETGAQKRLAAIVARYPGFQAYVQGDPRGASLYILRPGDVPAGADVSSCYNRGVAVYK